MKHLKNNLKLVILLLSILSIYSCTGSDEYLKYTEGGEISYTGKIDSLKFYPGKNRVMVKGLIISDPKVTQLRVYWNNKADSIVVPINRTSGVDVVTSIIPDLPENIYNFQVKTFDAKGNGSVVQDKTTQVYGERYEASLSDRKISSSSLSSNLSLTINFATMDLTTGAYATEVFYTDKFNVEHTVTVPVADSQVIIPDYKIGSQFKQRSLFLPVPTSIDTFYTNFVSKVPEVIDLTYLIKNNAVPFIASSSSGRWGILADWTTNEAAKNHGGYGGWDEWSTGIFNLESGWGAPLITNGKVYQTLTLEPGTYTYKANPKINGSGIDSGYTISDFVYLTVTAGNTLPDSDAGILETDPLTIGFKRIIKTMSSTAVEVTFTLAQTKEVSLGISTTQGDARFCNILSFNLFKNNK